MTNQIPRALLQDIALSLSLKDAPSAAVLLGADDDGGRSAAVFSYRALLAHFEGDADKALRYVDLALHVLETRYWEPDVGEARRMAETMRLLPAPETPMPPALEAVSPRLAQIRMLRLKAFLLEKAGRRDEALLVNARLPEAAQAK